MSFWKRFFGAKETQGATITEAGPSASPLLGAHPQPAISHAKLVSTRRALAAKRDEAVRAGLKATKSNKSLQALFRDKAWMDATFRREELVAAAAQGRSDDVEVLLIDGAAPDTIGDSNNAPLHVSAYHGHLAVVEVLLRYGADKNLRGDQGAAPLHLAAHEGRVNIAECLIRNGVEIDARDSANMTPLHYAADHGRTNVAEILLANGADANAKSNNGVTPLHRAAEKDHQNLARVLLFNKADVNAKDNQGNTPLHWAAFVGYKTMVELLLNHKPDALAENDSGQTPLSMARMAMDKGLVKQRFTDHKGVIELLRRYGAEGKVAGAPTLSCAGCHRVYRIGDDALVVTLESGLDLTPLTVIISDAGMPDREDLVCSLESVENVEGSKEKARQNWTVIEDSLARGQRRTWRCRACDRINSYL